MIEHFSDVFPDIGISVIEQVLIIHALYLSHNDTLVVASKQRDAFWVSHF